MFHSFLIFVRSKNLEFFKNGIYNLVLDLVLRWQKTINANSAYFDCKKFIFLKIQHFYFDT